MWTAKGYQGFNPRLSGRMVIFSCFFRVWKSKAQHIQLGHRRCQGWRRSWNPMVWISLAAAILKSCLQGVLDVVIDHGWVLVDSIQMGMGQTRWPSNWMVNPKHEQNLKFILLGLKYWAIPRSCCSWNQFVLVLFWSYLEVERRVVSCDSALIHPILCG